MIYQMNRRLRKAIAEGKKHSQHILLVILTVTSILIIYGQDFEVLVNESLQSESLSHILLMPIFVGILFYLKKEVVKASLAFEKQRGKTRVRHIDGLVGIVLCTIAFLVYWYGSYTFYPLEYHLLSLPIFIMGITLILFNLKALIILIPSILFLLFLTPPPTDLMHVIGGSLANFNTQASYTLLRTFNLPVSLSSSYGPPTIMLTTSTEHPASFTIDLACSGTYSLIAFAMFAAFLAFIVSASVLKKTILFVLGFLIFEVLSIIRITSIIFIAYWFGEMIAMVVFHSIAGLLVIFFGMLFVLFVAEKLMKIQIFPRRQKQPFCPKCEASSQSLENFCVNCGRFLSSFHAKVSKKFWIKVGLLLLGCSIVTLSIHAPAFAIAQGPIEVGSGWESATNVFPSKMECQDVNYTLKFLYRDTNFEKVARQDASLTYAYYPDDESKAVVYILVGVANSLSNLHSWEVCLITWQTAQGRYPLVTVIDSKDMQILQDVPIIARYLVFKNPQNYTQVTLYWYEKATFHMGVTVEQKYVRISLIILEYNVTNYEVHAKEYENELLAVGQSVAFFWEPMKAQSLISLGIPAQQLLLIFSISFVALTETLQYFNELRRRNNNRKIFNKFASAKEKMVLRTTQELAKEKRKIGTQDIREAIERKIGESIKLDTLLKMLSHLEEYGFIRKDMACMKNEPVLVWKT